MTDVPMMSLNQSDGGQSAASRHFRLSLQAVVARLLHTLASDAETTQINSNYPFLTGYQAQLQAAEPQLLNSWERAQWWEARAMAYTQEATAHLPLAALAHENSLSRLALRVLLAAGLVEEDIRFGALFATLQDPLPARRPCIGLLGWLVGDTQQEIWPACRTLLEQGLVVADNRSEPRAEWVLRVPAPLWDAIRGTAATDLHLPNLHWLSPDGFPTLDDLILPQTLHAQIENLPALMGSNTIGALVLRGMRGTGRRTVIGSVARALGYGILLAEQAKPDDERWFLLGSLATLTHAIPVLRLDPGPGETLELPALRGYTGPVGITLGRSGGLGGPLVEQALTLVLPPPDPDARRRFWARADVPFDNGALDEVVEHFLLTGGHIQQAAALSLTYAQLDGRQQVEGQDVQRSTRALNRQALETLATHLDTAQGWSDLVVGETV
ncbi:MAG: hypothetical protein KDH89_21030, partial [Anaerolineae bacterium]|nr:hypothetical protein [Anaerolineae bacterium]